MTSSMRVFGGPGRYLQGPGALDTMGPWLAPLGRRAALVADDTVLRLFGERIVAACAAAGITCEPVRFGGEITPAEVDRLAALAAPLGEGFVIGCGGGRAMDAGKGVAHRLGRRVVTVPTAASSDAPTSRIYVLYDENHRLLRTEHLPASPDVVVVDTAAVVTAPPVLFSAGIGDAVVKTFEVGQCMAAGGPNVFGARACAAAGALADLAYQVLRAHALPALEAVRAGRVTDDVERVVEATVLHSGLGFESGGLSICHAMTRGLSAVRGTRDALHGQQVGYALQVQFALERRPEAFVEDVRAFLGACGLPLSLAALGLPDPADAELRTIAEATLTAPHARNFERPLQAGDLVAAMRAVEARAGA